ncbi:FemAB family PEP-CTERM system-associated protein [Marinimicrobium sp. C6131]|uniref:FemAB family XrtA/PEP-CTERM system-associated protein n=1 Tax=Marinimicrobium sp. C6131 TaxID=3022676 RepID=UPI00223E57D5|nr:FemAB family XrtA/PEP-CTERM system-associated protein [Marinimicrobium sp. C6131]UZJ43924.1 FemAB family PEP-CTERM system-associated protein [Marinimicrobium sp. C6131]
MEGLIVEQPVNQTSISKGASSGSHESELDALKKKLKILKAQKADVARQFRTAEPGSEVHSNLVEQMQAVSRELKSLEAHIKALRSEPRVMGDDQEKLPPFFLLADQSRYSGEFSIRELSEADWPKWEAYVSASPRAPLYLQRRWSDLVRRSFGHPTRVWVGITPEGEILGGVPLTFFRSRLFGRFAVATPYVNYGGVLTPYWNVARALFERLQTVAMQENLSHIEVRSMQPGLWPNSSEKKVSMVLPLPGTLEQLEDSLTAKVRAQSRKAEEHHPTIAFGGLDLLDDFYRVFARNMRDLGTPVYAKGWFANVLSEPGLAATLVVVKVRGRAVSAGFLLGHGPMLEIPWASTIKPANALNTNMWMYRKILDYAVSEGYEFFDFGRSTRGAGTYHFKKQWGAKPYEHHWYYITPDHSKPPELNPDNPKFRLMIALWKRMPVWLSRLVGPPIVKHLP